MARGQPEAVGVVEQAAGAQRLVVVVERLAHAHEDDVGHAASAVVAQHAGEVQDLVDDLLGASGPRRSPSLPGGAERAAHGAADLRGDADRGAAPATSMSTASTGWPSAVANSVLRAVPLGAARVSTSVSDTRRQPLGQRLRAGPAAGS